MLNLPRTETKCQLQLTTSRRENRKILPKNVILNANEHAGTSDLSNNTKNPAKSRETIPLTCYSNYCLCRIPRVTARCRAFRLLRPLCPRTAGRLQQRGRARDEPRPRQVPWGWRRRGRSHSSQVTGVSL
jgi:hypothetical protein